MIDLHCHSTVSDGMLSPTEVVRLARQNGCTLLA
ncbi:phosphatase, partial [Neisseria sp. P0015.S004]